VVLAVDELDEVSDSRAVAVLIVIPATTDHTHSNMQRQSTRDMPAESFGWDWETPVTLFPAPLSKVEEQ